MTFLSSYLRSGLREAGWQNVDLWVATLAIGTGLELGDVNAITSGGREPTAGQYDAMACALNERLDDLGLNHPVTAWRDLPDRAL